MKHLPCIKQYVIGMHLKAIKMFWAFEYLPQY